MVGPGGDTIKQLNMSANSRVVGEGGDPFLV